MTCLDALHLVGGTWSIDQLFTEIISIHEADLADTKPMQGGQMSLLQGHAQKSHEMMLYYNPSSVD